MNLFKVSMLDVAAAWDVGGAASLATACERCSDMSAAELELKIQRGDYELLGIGHEGKPVGWCAISLQKKRLYVHAIYAPGATGIDAFEQLRAYAKHNGCESIQGACVPSVARLWTRRFNAKPVQTIMRIEV